MENGDNMVSEGCPNCDPDMVEEQSIYRYTIRGTYEFMGVRYPAFEEFFATHKMDVQSLARLCIHFADLADNLFTKFLRRITALLLVRGIADVKVRSIPAWKVNRSEVVHEELSQQVEADVQDYLVSFKDKNIKSVRLEEKYVLIDSPIGIPYLTLNLDHIVLVERGGNIYTHFAKDLQVGDKILDLNPDKKKSWGE